MQRAWPSCAFLMEPLAEPEAPSRWWQEQRVGLASPQAGGCVPEAEGSPRHGRALPGEAPSGATLQPAPSDGHRAGARRTPTYPHVQALQSRLEGVLLLKQKAPPSPVLSQPVPAPVGNGGRLSPETMHGVFLLIINPFIKGMWFVLNEGKMPRKQPTCGQLSRPWGRRMWLLSSRNLDGV